MRRVLLMAMGLLEALAAIVLGGFAWQLPTADDVSDAVERVENLSAATGGQVRALKAQVVVARKRQPAAQRRAAQLQQRIRGSTAALRAQERAFDAALGQLRDFLDARLGPAAERAGLRLADAAARLRADADRLHAHLLRNAPLDLIVGQAVHDGLGDVDGGLKTAHDLLDEEGIEALAARAEGLGVGLRAAADRIDALASVTNPLAALGGGKPQPIWPEGKALAAAVRSAGAGCAAAAPEIRGLTAGLPQARALVEEGRRGVGRARGALGAYLEARRAATPALESLALGASRVADEVLTLSDDLARALVGGSALLRLAQGRLGQALDPDGELKTGVRQTLDLLDGFADALPALPEGLDSVLEEQEESLDRLEKGVDRVTAIFPEVSRRAARTLRLARLLLLLASLIVCLHGCYLVYSARPQVAPPATAVPPGPVALAAGATPTTDALTTAPRPPREGG
jgi:hypothetical protein